MQHEYSVHIYWDEAEDIFVATVPELVECTASGATHEEALMAVHEAIEDWIASAKRLQRQTRPSQAPHVACPRMMPSSRTSFIAVMP